jgi:hypothetical protein
VIIEPMAQSTEGDNTDVLWTKAGNPNARECEPDNAEQRFYGDPSASRRATRQ